MMAPKGGQWRVSNPAKTSQKYLDMPWNLLGRVNLLGTFVQPSARNIHRGLLGHWKENPKKNPKAALHSGSD